MACLRCGKVSPEDCYEYQCDLAVGPPSPARTLLKAKEFQKLLWKAQRLLESLDRQWLWAAGIRCKLDIMDVVEEIKRVAGEDTDQGPPVDVAALKAKYSSGKT